MLVCAVLLPASARAQWHWVDAQGRQVFSDRPPPLEIPEKNIRQRPAPRSPDSKPAANPQPPDEATGKAEGAPAATGSTPAASASNKATDPELEARKAQADAAQKAQQQAEAERNAQARADNCARARQAKANLESGLPLMQVNAQGYRVLMDEATRAAELQRAQNSIASNCPR